MLEGFYVRPQEDVTRGAWVPVVLGALVDAEFLIRNRHGAYVRRS